MARVIRARVMVVMMPPLVERAGLPLAGGFRRLGGEQAVLGHEPADSSSSFEAPCEVGPALGVVRAAGAMSTMPGRGSTRTSTRTAREFSPRRRPQRRTGSCWRAGGSAPPGSTWGSVSHRGTAARGRTGPTSRASRSRPTWRRTRYCGSTTCFTRARR